MHARAKSTAKIDLFSNRLFSTCSGTARLGAAVGEHAFLAIVKASVTSQPVWGASVRVPSLSLKGLTGFIISIIPLLDMIVIPTQRLLPKQTSLSKPPVNHLSFFAFLCTRVAPPAHRCPPQKIRKSGNAQRKTVAVAEHCSCRSMPAIPPGRTRPAARR
jgi:hypothetical protein